MEGNVLCLNNKKVFDFYKEHTNLGFEEMNVLFVDILNKMFVEISPNMDSGFACKVMNEMKDLNLNMNKLHNDNVNNVTQKFAEFKKDYASDIKIILNNNNQDYINYFGPSQIIGTLITLFAFYLVFKCSKTPGHNMILNFIAALCCAPFYIIYRLFIKPC